MNFRRGLLGLRKRLINYAKIRTLGKTSQPYLAVFRPRVCGQLRANIEAETR